MPELRRARAEGEITVNDLPLNAGWMIWPLLLTALVALGRTGRGFRRRACAVHCLFMPLVVTLLPFGALTFLADETFERALIIGSLLLATASFCWVTGDIGADALYSSWLARPFCSWLCGQWPTRGGRRSPLRSAVLVWRRGIG